MASCRSIKRSGRGRVRVRMDFRFGPGSGSGKVLVRNLAANPRKSVRGSRFGDMLRKSTAEEEDEGKKYAGVHHVVSVWSRKQGHRLYANSCSYDDENWSSESIMWSPFPKSTPILVGSCNGLLCFAYDDDDGCKSTVVWEPSTERLLVIPEPLPTSLNRPCACKSIKCERGVLHKGGGLHFDSRSRDYKLFRFTTVYFDYINEQGYKVHGSQQESYHVEVYSLRNNAWKELTYPLFNLNLQGKNEKYPVSGEGEGICVNGVCYWHACCAGDNSFMLSYSFLTREFSIFRRPVFDTDSSMLVEMDGLLCLLFYPDVIDSDDPTATIWLKAYISLPSQPWLDVVDFEVTVVGLHKPLWFGKWNDSYYLLLKGPQGDLLEYDYTRKVFNKIHKEHSPSNTYDYEFVYETKTKNNANVWHSSFHALELQK